MNVSRAFVELTQPEIAAHLRRSGLIILPTGSIEQHGPHLPACTDILAARAIAHRVAERMDGLVLPGGDLGVTPMHMPFEGTLSLTPETYIRVIVEVCACAARHGAKSLLILNWHEGNIPSLALAADVLHREHGLAVAIVQACYVAQDLFGARHGGLTHGGAIEALAVLAARPDLVHLDRIEDIASSDLQRGQTLDKLRRTRSFQPVLTDIRAIAPSGWYGTPRDATREEGQEMVEAIADAIASEAREIFRQLELVQGPASARDAARREQ